MAKGQNPLAAAGADDEARLGDGDAHGPGNGIRWRPHADPPASVTQVIQLQQRLLMTRSSLLMLRRNGTPPG